ncbi:Nucleotide-binding universal stress protein, UspA family [Marinococcus luteus]|uniref:Nucleotide-binding universal stress protein, UspA family n=1 Tax=Marinococcus luteus TaxID=1122204 RepID=A0A1H2QKV6_9BACI|nr:universal stress protein [Marinococcus luteus]SDW07781.1 Nucleotide-binding universal stress protein, UspA family [Marinococcus luteus]
MTNHFQNILTAVDSSDESMQAFRRGLSLAKKHHSQLTVAHVIEYKTLNRLIHYIPTIVETAGEQGRTLLNIYKAEAEGAGVEIQTRMAHGMPKFIITKELAPEHDTDLIITGASGAGTVGRFMMGSVSTGIVRHAKCDVLVVRNKDSGSDYKKMIIAIDGSEESWHAFDKGIALAVEENATVLITHVIDLVVLTSMEQYDAGLITEMERYSGQLLEEHREKALNAGLEHVEAAIYYGAPKVVIAEELGEKYKADLIVLGASGLNTTERFFLGSVSEGVVHRAACDVLIVRLPDEEQQ